LRSDFWFPKKGEWQVTLRIGDGWAFNEFSARTSADKRTKSTEYVQKLIKEISARN